MQRTVVIDVVGLSDRIIGEYTPFLLRWSESVVKKHVKPIVPAVTCSMQSTYLTGTPPETHGIVGNGWFFKDECEIKFWRQSNNLVNGSKIWDEAKKTDPNFTCANMFWWYNMYSSVDYSVTPRPNYLADGRKIPDVYSHPPELRDHLQQQFGQFPLFEFWGPKTSIRSSRWIANAARATEEKFQPTLSLVYLPHLDYCLQKFGHDLTKIGADLQELDALIEELVKFYESRDVQVVLLSEYGITEVSNPVSLNKVLRKHGWLQIREERGLELLDAGASQAFAVPDHQVAHIYVKDPSNIAMVRDVLEKVDGVAEIWGKDEQIAHQIANQRSGDLIVLSEPSSWFTYYYWLDDNRAPDFARTVDIHRKPGYDPVEMFADPDIKMLMPLVAWKLLKKKLGFRVLMDIIPLKPSLIKGSHGLVPKDKKDWPLLLARDLPPGVTLNAVEVYHVIWNKLTNLQSAPSD